MKDRMPRIRVILKNILSYFLLASLVILVGTRMHFVGTDTNSYYRIFEMIASDGSWFRVQYYEPLFVFLNQVVAKVGLSAQEMIFATALSTLIPLFLFFKKTSPSANLSIVLYMSVFGYLMLFNAVRQAIAIAFFVWFVFFMYNKRFFWAFAFGCVSVMFHYSAVFVIFAFLVISLIGPFFVICLYFVSLSFLINGNFSSLIFIFIFDAISFLLPKKYFYYISGIGDVPDLGLKDVINQVLFFVAFYFYFCKTKVSLSNVFKVALLCTMISTILFNFFYYVKYLDRLASYFFIFNAVSIPLFIYVIKGRFERMLVSFLVGFLAILLFARSIINGSNGITPYQSWFLPGVL
ncbi:EpsG family protein [Salinivibrio sp. VYel6]|uniref:EpsG family protein n=1 Tax=Salinivibrio sp. VYel6 TaxID=2490493 RepID=UPI00128B5135|nr:EpsG family protein [Salinivibrio sp. VYel6]MPX98156.1 EpsG family protein [Salinivibrio sp. VYel6]